LSKLLKIYFISSWLSKIAFYNFPNTFLHLSSNYICCSSTFLFSDDPNSIGCLNTSPQPILSNSFTTKLRFKKSLVSFEIGLSYGNFNGYLLILAKKLFRSRHAQGLKNLLAKLNIRISEYHHKKHHPNTPDITFSTIRFIF